MGGTRWFVVVGENRGDGRDDSSRWLVDVEQDAVMVWLWCIVVVGEHRGGGYGV